MSDLLELKGVGAVLAKKLEKLGVFSIQNLVYHFPTRYIDRRRELKIADLYITENENYFCKAKISKIQQIRIRGGRIIVNGTVEDDTGKINVTWFNNPYIISNFTVGDIVLISGQPQGNKLINPKIRKYNDTNDIFEFGKVEAIYPETRGIKSALISKLVKQIFEKKLFQPKEILPKKAILEQNLIDIQDAVQIMHSPENEEKLKEAKKRIAFEEIYNILLEVKKKKLALAKFKSNKIKINKEIHESIILKLPFDLTESQKKAIEEIYSDMQKSIPMHRLLNGDVGSGKTIVATFASLQAIQNNYQVVFLAPTGILAMQHYQVLQNIIKDTDIKIHLVTSATKNLTKKLKDEISDKNNKEIFIGTHALLFNLDILKNVGLLIIDEQHKFGVKQREILENLNSQNLGKKYLPHVLTMTATPIPRTLALTLYGDLEVSILQKPITRKSIITKCIYDEPTQSKMYEWIRKKIKENKYQIYVVCPLIEESQLLDTKSAVKEFEKLKGLFPEFNIEILHGKIKSDLKDKILDDFKNGKIDILVSTSVIEVGIDNPNATIMIIEGAERFGLAQLHQIRGRVGRSDIQSYCFLKTTNNTPSERLEYFATHQDGFEVAEYDLQSRGPGEVYGNAQSGIPKLKVANILDLELIKTVRQYL